MTYSYPCSQRNNCRFRILRTSACLPGFSEAMRNFCRASAPVTREALPFWTCFLTRKSTEGDADWKGREGFVPTVCREVAPSSENAVTVICGPPIMIRFTLPVFFELGFSKENIITSLEMRMKCGIGKCGRCNVGEKYVCKDGPVFSLAELDKLTKEY
ncbi:MAG: hypothetical protein KKH02_11345 [Proteobacteria bacterium]|nr:hypothetical protein [Pseudomonadota bacterium]